MPARTNIIRPSKCGPISLNIKIKLVSLHTINSSPYLYRCVRLHIKYQRVDISSKFDLIVTDPVGDPRPSHGGDSHHAEARAQVSLDPLSVYLATANKQTHGGVIKRVKSI